MVTCSSDLGCSIETRVTRVTCVARVHTYLDVLNPRIFKTFQGYLKKKFKAVLTTYVLLGTVNEVNINIFT